MALAAACIACARAAAAQTAERERLTLDTTIPQRALEDLPPGSNLFSLFETVEPDVIVDRIDTGGVRTGVPARIGAHGSSWTQTKFHVGDIDVTDPDGSGEPMLLPDANEWSEVRLTTGLMPITRNTPGLAISLAPRMPASEWTRTIEGSVTPSVFVASPIAEAPAIERLNWWGSANLLLSGPVIPNRLGVVFAANWARATRFERADPTSLAASTGSAFLNLVFTPDNRTSLRTIGWLQQNAHPFDRRVAYGQLDATQRDRAAHAQMAFERGGPGERTWKAFAGITLRHRSPELTTSAAPIVTERLDDGPVEELLYPGTGTDWRGEVGARVQPASGSWHALTHRPELGVELIASHASVTAPFKTGTLRIGELVGNLPARMWVYNSPTTGSDWGSTTFAAYARDELSIHRRVTLDAGLRLEHVTGSAHGAEGGITWTDLYPRATLRWDITDLAGLAAFIGYGRYGDDLPLRWLAYGDPMAPTATYSRWTPPAGTQSMAPAFIGPIVARVGPGSAGNPQFSAIDPELRRPSTNELMFGFESRPRRNTVIRLVGMGRLAHNGVGVLNVGVPESAYVRSTIPDEGFGDGPSQLPAFNRLPSSFGADRYLLTNPDQPHSTYVGAELTGQTETEHLFFLLGFTAGRVEGLSAYPGFKSSENDYGVQGDVFIDPNSRTFAQGRDFTERGYTIKTATAYRFPHDLRIGLIGRYQDGQHFSRFVIDPNLNQGTELIRAFRNGRSRFTFTATGDLRVQKGIEAGTHHLDLILDAYNFLNLALQVEEDVRTGPTWRRTTAVQPPLAIRAGLRIQF